MSEMIISSCDLDLAIFGDEDVLQILKQSKFLYSYIPEVKIKKSSDSINARIWLKVSESNQVKVSYPDSEFHYKNFDIQDAISFIEFIFERVRQENGIVSIHGACAIYNNTPIVCWGGATNMGKSRLAHAIKIIGGNMIYDEKLLLSMTNGQTVGGIRYLYNHKDYYQSLYGDTKYIDLPYLANPINQPIFLYSYIKDEAKFEYSKWSSSKFEWHLYEEMCRKIRGTSRRFFNFSLPVDSLDTIELAAKRIEFIQSYTTKVSCFYISGSEQTCLNFIQNQLF